MKKTLILLSIGLVALASCDKQQKNVVVDLSKAPAWVTDEESPVPVEFGGGLYTMAVTKGTAMTSDDFKTAQYDILAAKADGTAMAGFEGGVLVTNQEHAIVGGDQAGQMILTVDFGGPRFYPYLSTGGNAFKFYGYGIDGTHKTLTNNTVSGIAIGNNDIIWAKSQDISDDILNALGVPDYFNARYMSAAYKASLDGSGNLNETEYYSYLPKLDFAHITSQIQFLIRAEDEYAANSLATGEVKVQSITINGIPVQASLNVITGAMTGSANGNLAVSGIKAGGQIPQYLLDDQATVAADCGEHVIILPCASIDLEIVISMPAGAPSTTETITLNNVVPKVGGDVTEFLAGKKYLMTVVFQSIEEIKVVTELASWGEPVQVDPIILE